MMSETLWKTAIFWVKLSRSGMMVIYVENYCNKVIPSQWRKPKRWVESMPRKILYCLEGRKLQVYKRNLMFIRLRRHLQHPTPKQRTVFNVKGMIIWLKIRNVEVEILNAGNAKGLGTMRNAATHLVLRKRRAK